MTTLAPQAATTIFAWPGEGRRAVALRHALLQAWPWLEVWGDHALRPSSVIMMRWGDDQWEAMGAGQPGPAIEWLAEPRTGHVALLAPESWIEPIREAVGSVQTTRVVTRRLHRMREQPAAPALVKSLDARASRELAELAPAWAWRCWGSAGRLLEKGAAFGVSDSLGLVAASWIVETDGVQELIGVYVKSAFRRLGLGFAVTRALVNHIVLGRRRQPLWVHAPENLVSAALAERLGFTRILNEPLLRWSCSEAPCPVTRSSLT